MVGPLTVLMMHPFAVFLRMSLHWLAGDFMDDALVRAENATLGVAASGLGVDGQRGPFDSHATSDLLLKARSFEGDPRRLRSEDTAEWRMPEIHHAVGSPFGRPMPMPAGKDCEALESRQEAEFIPRDCLPELSGSIDESMEVQNMQRALVVVNLLVMFVVRLVLACCYKRSITDARPPWQGCPPSHLLQPHPGTAAANWRHDTFSCFDSCNYCMFGFFCMDCRIGDTYAATNVGPGCGPGFWMFVIVFELLALSGIVQGLQLFIHVAFAIWMTTRRRELRKAMGDPNPDYNAFNDCMCYWCCSCCVTIQEARQVDEATGTEVECCLRLRHTAQQSVIGLPVLAAPLVAAAPAPQEQQHIAAPLVPQEQQPIAS